MNVPHDGDIDCSIEAIMERREALELRRRQRQWVETARRRGPLVVDGPSADRPAVETVSVGDESADRDRDVMMDELWEMAERIDTMLERRAARRPAQRHLTLVRDVEAPSPD